VKDAAYRKVRGVFLCLEYQHIQLIPLLMTHRYRGQAPSHSFDRARRPYTFSCTTV